MKLKRSYSMPMRIYATLLLLYPEAFRSDYGDEMLQLFGDCYRDARETGRRSELLKLWFSALFDLVVNACAERFKQMMTWQWLFGSVRLSVGAILMLGSAAIFSWILAIIVVILMIPWDIGIPPEGSFATAINSFFDSGNVFLPSALMLLCEAVAFLRSAVSRRYSFTTLFWYFTLLNAVVPAIGGMVAMANVMVANVVFPHINTWEGDQSYYVATVYLGLVVVGTIVIFFAYQAWRAPSLLWLKSKRKVMLTQ